MTGDAHGQRKFYLAEKETDSFGGVFDIDGAENDALVRILFADAFEDWQSPPTGRAPYGPKFDDGDMLALVLTKFELAPVKELDSKVRRDLADKVVGSREVVLLAEISDFRRTSRS